MSESTDGLLRRAHELIENDQHEQAQEILAPLLETDSDNPGLWWVYAHAVTDTTIGVAALDRVLQLDPTYPGARELKEDVLSAQGLLADELNTELDLASAQSSRVDEGDIDDWESIKPAVEEAPSNQRTGRGFVLIIVALLVLASGAVLVLSGAIDIDEILSLFADPTVEPIIVVAAPTTEAAAALLPAIPESTDEPTVAATDVAPTSTAEPTVEPTTEPTTEPTDRPTAEPTSESTAEPTTEPTAEPTTEPTAEPTTEPTAEPTTEPTSEPTTEPTAETTIEPTVVPERESQSTVTATSPPSDVEAFIELVGAQISDYSIEASQSAARETQLGLTIDILVCATPGTEFTVRLNGVMNAAARVHGSIPAQIEAFAVSLVNCADPNASARTIGVARDILDDFAEGETDAKTFQRAWRPLA